MIENRLIALAFRLCALAVGACGLAIGMDSLFYYTTQSNLLALALMLALVVRTALGLKGGICGSASYLERFQSAVCVTLFFTFAVFWGVIAARYADAFSAGSVILHAVMPALVISDRLLFAKRGRIRKIDVLFASLIPTGYVIQTAVIGFFNLASFRGSSFPYPFMNYALYPVAAPLFTLCIAVLFVSVAAFVYKLDSVK